MTPFATVNDLRRVIPNSVLNALSEGATQVQAIQFDAALVAANTIELRVESQLVTQDFDTDNDTTLDQLASAIAAFDAVDSATVTETDPPSNGDSRREVVVIAREPGDKVALADAGVTGGNSQPNVSIVDLTNDSFELQLQDLLNNAATEVARYRERFAVTGHASEAADGKLIDYDGHFLARGFQSGWPVRNLGHSHDPPLDHHIHRGVDHVLVGGNLQAQRLRQGHTAIASVTNDVELTLEAADFTFGIGDTWEIVHQERRRDAETFYAGWLLFDTKMPMPIDSSLGSPRVIEEYDEDLAQRFRRQFRRTVGVGKGTV